MFLWIFQLSMAFTAAGPFDLLEWFLASVGIVLLVTFIYVRVLNRSPPPAGPTVEKLEQQQQQKSQSPQTVDTSALLSDSRQALAMADYRRAIDLCVHAATASLGSLMRNAGGDPSDMNVSDLAYLVQSKARMSPQISQPMYQLNSLRLKVAQGQSVTKEEAEWAINIASWLAKLTAENQILL